MQAFDADALDDTFDDQEGKAVEAALGAGFDARRRQAGLQAEHAQVFLSFERGLIPGQHDASANGLRGFALQALAGQFQRELQATQGQGRARETSRAQSRRAGGAQLGSDGVAEALLQRTGQLVPTRSEDGVRQLVGQSPLDIVGAAGQQNARAVLGPQAFRLGGSHEGNGVEVGAILDPDFQLIGKARVGQAVQNLAPQTFDQTRHDLRLFLIVRPYAKAVSGVHFARRGSQTARRQERGHGGAAQAARGRAWRGMLLGDHKKPYPTDPARALASDRPALGAAHRPPLAALVLASRP